MGGLCVIVFQNSIQYKYLKMIIKKYCQNYWKTLITSTTNKNIIQLWIIMQWQREERRGRDRMVVGFTTTYAISAYHHWCLWVWISIRARCTPLCDKVCQWLATGRWFSPGPSVSSANKTDRHDITEILLKVALNTIKQTNINDSDWNNFVLLV